MDIRRFYSNQDINDGTIELIDEEAYHLKKVLRAQIGDTVEVTNGLGNLYIGKVDSLKGDRVKVKINENHRFPKREGRFIIAPSLLRRNPMNLIIEKLSELGVPEITPVLFNRTEIKPANKVVQKWEKIAITSLKVNKRVWMSRINEPIYLQQLIDHYADVERKIMLDIDGDRSNYAENKADTIIVVGPPGDFIEREKTALHANGYTAANINGGTLRVETAAITAAAIYMRQLN